MNKFILTITMLLASVLSTHVGSGKTTLGEDYGETDERVVTCDIHNFKHTHKYIPLRSVDNQNT